MRVLYDHQIFENQRFGGISRYFYELLAYYKERGQVEWKLALKYSSNAYLQMLPEIQRELLLAPRDYYKEFLGGVDFRGKGRLFEAYKKFNPEKQVTYNIDIAKGELALGNFDVFHPTYYNDYFLNHIGNKPFVLTVYDMIHEIFPEYFLGDKVSGLKRKLVQKASKIIAISESTKNDLVSLFGVDPENISVVYLGSSLSANLANPVPDAVSLPEQYLLYVGERGYYKNFYFFIQSVIPILKEWEDLQIVCTGSGFNETEEGFLRHLGINDRLIHFSADDALLAILYQNALAFVFPSLYEGFGIPLLEAFSCGCPVLTSHTSSLPEVGGEAVIYFEPKNAKSIQEAVARVVQDGNLRQKMKLDGYEQLKKFSWQKTASETEAVYKSVLR